MVERPDRTLGVTLSGATFFADPPFAVGSHATLGEDEVRHLRVLRLAVGDRVALRDGAGQTATGRLVRTGKTQALVEIEEAATIDPLPPIHLLASPSLTATECYG